jgi:hypothetical protein
MLKQQWTIEEISIFSNSSHLEWRAELSDTILKGTHPGTIPARFGLIWFSGFRGEDLNVIFYQNMPNLHNRYISAERNISQKNQECLLNYSLPCRCSQNFSSFWLILKQQWTIKISSPLFSIFSLAAILVGSRDHRTQLWKGAIQGSFHQSLVQIGPVASEELIKMWKVDGRTTDAQWVRWAKKCILIRFRKESLNSDDHQFHLFVIMWSFLFYCLI